MPNTSQLLKMDHQLPNVLGKLAIVPNRPLRASLLLSEAHADSLSTRTLLLSDSGYHVATASTRKQIFDLRFAAIHLAVLSDSLGPLGLRGAAEDVRRQWPLARVLIIGAAQVVLDDPLYDDAVDRRISAPDLLLTLTKMAAYPFSHRVEVWSLNSGSVDLEDAFKSKRKVVPVESDPTKDPRNYEGPRNEPEDLPAEERRDWRAV